MATTAGTASSLDKGKKGRTGGRGRSTLTANSARDLQLVKDYCRTIESFCTLTRRENMLLAQQDLEAMCRRTDKLFEEEEVTRIGLEALVTVVNQNLRKQILKEKLSKDMVEDKELNTVFQTHKDDFNKFVWERRCALKRELRQVFSVGPTLMGKVSDLIAEFSREGMDFFDKNNASRLAKDAIMWDIIEDVDIPGYFARSVTFMRPKVPTALKVTDDQTIVTFQDEVKKEFISRWNCVYGTHGVWAARLGARSMQLDMVNQAVNRLVIQRFQAPEKFSYISFLARILDAVHPTHVAPSITLSYPLYSFAYLKKRILSLGYKLPEDTVGFDLGTVTSIMDQMKSRLERHHRVYFEISFPVHASIRFGFVSSRYSTRNDYTRYPGKDNYSFGFDTQGYVYWCGSRSDYISSDIEQRNPEDDYIHSGEFVTWGVMVDFYTGYVALVVDGEEKSAAFGEGSFFDEVIAEDQKNLLMGSQMVPMLAILPTEQSVDPDFGLKPTVKFNFHGPFVHEMNAISINASLAMVPERPPQNLTSLLDDPEERVVADEETKLQTAMEKSFYRTISVTENVRSFSHFPPSVHRGIVAASRIQQAWRRYLGRRKRANQKRRQEDAAIIIQRTARRMLQRVGRKKTAAAIKIQRAWRRRCFVWIALLRTIYQQPIPELHRRATVIQRAWRNWFIYKNNPIAHKYNRKIDDLVQSAITIQRWWRPIYDKIMEMKALKEKLAAVYTIQRVWRGYRLRKMLLPEVRESLRLVAAKLRKNRQQLLQVKGAYVLQKTWRTYMVKKIRADKTKAKNRAATRIQAVWRGYWVRSMVHLRLTYGQAVFLSAVTKALRTSHFILKLYKPTGIVCPKEEKKTFDG